MREDHGLGPGHVGCLVDQRLRTNASSEFPVANMTWATPRAATAARMTPAASSAAARAMARRRGAPSPWRRRWSWSRSARRSACQVRLGPDWPVRAVVVPGRRSAGGGLEGGPALLAAHPGLRAAPARPGGLGQDRDGPAHGLVQGARRPGRGVGHPGGRPGRAVVASSAGNHGLGLAYAASKLGARVTVVVPTGASVAGLGPPPVRRAPRPPRRRVPRGRGPRARAGGMGGQPLRLALQRPRRHRRPGHPGA